MAITPISTRSANNQPRKDGRKRGSSQKDDHTMIRIEDAKGTYLGMFDCHNPFVTSFGEFLEKNKLKAIDNITYQSSKDTAEAGPQSIAFK